MNNKRLKDYGNLEQYSAAMDTLDTNEICTIVAILSDKNAIDAKIYLSDYYFCDLTNIVKILLKDNSKASIDLITSIKSMLERNADEVVIPASIVFDTIANLKDKNIREIDKLILDSYSAYWNLRLASEVYGVDAHEHVARALELSKELHTNIPQ